MILVIDTSLSSIPLDKKFRGGAVDELQIL
jgi:hypothetical protein